jgi:phosphoglycolate phosphatase (TIGR01487 family)
MIEIIVLDIDGTITEKNQSILPETMEMLRKVKMSNPRLTICLASGNVMPVMIGISNILNIGQTLFGENGGILFHHRKIETFFQKDKTVEAYRVIEKELGATEFITNRWRETSISFILDGDNDFTSYERRFGVVIQDSGYAKHILNIGQNKGFAVKKIMELYNVDKTEILACGDGDNDVEMFKVAGNSGSPANGSNKAKKNASYVSDESYGKGLRDIFRNFEIL